MFSQHLCHITCALLLVAPCSASGEVPRPDLHEQHAANLNTSLNDAVLREVRVFSSGESPPYIWNPEEHTDGVSRQVRWHDTLLASPDASHGIHCSGVTFEVWVRALASINASAAGPSLAEMRRIKSIWYLQTGGESGPVEALESTGLGTRIRQLRDLQPGDIVQFWRNNGNGHSAVFIDHTRRSDGSIKGLVYWSAQSSSGGVGRRFVSMGSGPSQITEGRLFAIRPHTRTPATVSPSHSQTGSNPSK